jgi:hypothetical protein
MFASTIQPPIVSLFSSTGSDPLALFSAHTDASLPADSFLHFFLDGTSDPPPGTPRTLIRPHPLTGDTDGEGYKLEQTVLHLQSPTLRTTYIRCPPADPRTTKRERDADLGLRHPWMNIQVRNLGREWSFELGLVDTAGREGVIRCSTFQVRRSVNCQETDIDSYII